MVLQAVKIYKITHFKIQNTIKNVIGKNVIGIKISKIKIHNPKIVQNLYIETGHFIVDTLWISSFESTISFVVVL